MTGRRDGGRNGVHSRTSVFFKFRKEGKKLKTMELTELKEEETPEGSRNGGGAERR